MSDNSPGSAKLSPMKIQLNPSLLAGLLAVIAAFPAIGDSDSNGLSWETERISIEAGFGAEKVIAEFPFRNNSTETITITKTDSTCGCTVPELAKSVYLPGETGVLRAVFDARNRSGTQVKPIYVHTSETGAQPYKLTLEVEIPQAVKLEPRVRFWRLGEEPKPQTYTLTLHDKLPLSIDAFIDRRSKEPPSELYDVSIEEVEPQKKYLLHITPKTTATKTTSTLLVHSPQDEEGALQGYPIYAIIR